MKTVIHFPAIFIHELSHLIAIWVTGCTHQKNWTMTLNEYNFLTSFDGEKSWSKIFIVAGAPLVGFALTWIALIWLDASIFIKLYFVILTDILLPSNQDIEIANFSKTQFKK